MSTAPKSTTKTGLTLGQSASKSMGSSPTKATGAAATAYRTATAGGKAAQDPKAQTKAAEELAKVEAAIGKGKKKRDPRSFFPNSRHAA